MSDIPTVEERYAAAISRGDCTDILLAAGLQRHVLGATFLRLRAEWDQVRADLERAGQIAPSSAGRVRELEKEAGRLRALADRAQWPEDEGALRRQAAALLEEAAALPRRAAADALTARAVILVSLSTLGAAREAITTLALRMAERRRVSPADALQLAGRVLDVWLDETCHACDGTTVLGNRFRGDAERLCRACAGTGHRRDTIGAGFSQRLLAGDILAEIQRRVAAAAHGIKEALRSEAQAKPVSPALARRLAELRGETASAD